MANVNQLPKTIKLFNFAKKEVKPHGQSIIANMSRLSDIAKNNNDNVDVDLSEVLVHVEKGHSPKIELTEEMGIVMKYPTIDSFTDTGITDVTAENMLDVITTCIDHIYDKKGEEKFDAKDQTQKELTEFIEQLNTSQFREVQQFFDTMPKLKHVVTIENPKTKVKTDVVLQGLNDFFV